MSVCPSPIVEPKPRVRKSDIVSLLGDVTSPTTVAYYVSMTSDLRILSTEKHWPPRRQHTVYTNKGLESKYEVHSLPLYK